MDDILVALRAIVALGAVLGLLLFLSRRLQKSQAKGVSPLAGLMPKKLAKLSELVPSRPAAAPRARPEKITVVARSGIGGKAQLVVAEFGGIRYVLGVTEHGINVVDTQEAPPLAEEILAEGNRPAVSEMPDDIVDRALRSVA
ncbi:flagellar biosynthetic protein FliO [Microbacterium sp. WCS2018Hpa-9]|uniref:flagellar biosynthetic protein FliO n=1 Tax=Microbacterium sp. WCS2018Hpa-9 TaxID=3073635 RepID=UPI00288A9430|nr:flagellar biosynthetic protein FliO [Microbacterium sp. WCS2018Hpa-9]